MCALAIGCGGSVPSTMPSTHSDAAEAALPRRRRPRYHAPTCAFASVDVRALDPDAIVRVRSRQYLVGDVVGPTAPIHATLVRLSCLEDDALALARRLGGR